MSAGRISARAATAIGGLVLLGSLFLPWSHQLTTAVRATAPSPAATAGLPANPTAWQVYAAADVVLALLACALLAIAAWGRRARAARLTAAGGIAIAAAFVAHAIVTAPTNGLVFATTTHGPLGYVAPGATPGVGETVALVGLAVALAGLAATRGMGELAPWPASGPAAPDAPVAARTQP